MGPRPRTVMVLAIVCVGLVGLATGGASGRYSGQVRSVDLGLGAEGRMVVEELAERGVPRRREIIVTSETAIVVVARRPVWAVGQGKPYRETPVSLADVLAGDFVVVEWMERASRPVARRIVIVERTRPAR